ncbi:MAG: DUF4446 family protein [Jatrophihabitans sp.]|uniref:DUF4446 family protein n=1 Tax=Jatrophihabitans sp. TaxID=1932789 RepID=UPI003F816B45
MATNVAVFALILAYVALVVAYLAVRQTARLRRVVAAGGAAPARTPERAPVERRPERPERAERPVERIVERHIVERPAAIPDELLQTTQRTAALSNSLAGQLQDLRAHVDATAAEMIARLDEQLPDPKGALSNVALVRYDAFGEMSGRMSFSLALLDGNGDGITLTALAGTSTTSVYAKGVRNGQGEHDLSPEEQQAVSTALHRPRTSLLGRRAS